MNIQSFLELVEKRKSCRDYLEKPVPDEAIQKCLEAARFAPSACNKQPWRFVIVNDKSRIDKIAEKALLPGIPMPWLKKAPTIVVLCSELSMFAHHLAPLISKIPYHFIDMGIAGEHFVLAAETQGLGTCWIGWFNEKQIRKILSIPGSVRVISLISLGYPASPMEARERLPFEEIYSINKWSAKK